MFGLATNQMSPISASLAPSHMPISQRKSTRENLKSLQQNAGWWADETKGYRLEDIETHLLITSCDVCFIKDNTPAELAIIEGSTLSVRGMVGPILI
jgi:hypothetical protein